MITAIAAQLTSFSGASMFTLVLVAIVSLAAGAAVALVVSNSRTVELKAQVAALVSEAASRDAELISARTSLQTALEQKSATQADLATLTERLAQEQKQAQEKLALLSRASEEMRNAFQSLAAEALTSNNTSFLELARTKLETFQQHADGELAKREKAVSELVKPISDSLKSVDEQVRALEQSRADAYGALRQQLTTLGESQQALRSETSRLVQALRAPHVRGRWGEIQLRRVVELAGMLNYCDFVEQATVSTSEGRLRPDLIVRLPGGKNIVVDAKAPLAAYLEAIEASDEEARRSRLLAHAAQIKEHMTKLCSKGYQEQFDPTPDFVVMFLPGEVFFSAALEQLPALIEMGVEQKVIPASPTTLIALLRAVAYGWQQANLAENAQKISALGKRLYDSIRVMAGHMEKLGDSLGKSMQAYNNTVGSLERNVLPTARRFPELGVAAGDEITELEPKDEAARTLQAPDWLSTEAEKTKAAKA